MLVDPSGQPWPVLEQRNVNDADDPLPIRRAVLHKQSLAHEGVHQLRVELVQAPDVRRLAVLNYFSLIHQVTQEDSPISKWGGVIRTLLI